jgi:hypothetical protein
LAHTREQTLAALQKTCTKGSFLPSAAFAHLVIYSAVNVWLSLWEGMVDRRMKVVNVMASGQIKARASVLQSKTQKPVRFEISEGTRASVAKWM